MASHSTFYSATTTGNTLPAVFTPLCLTPWRPVPGRSIGQAHPVPVPRVSASGNEASVGTSGITGGGRRGLLSNSKDVWCLRSQGKTNAHQMFTILICDI